MLRFHDSVQLNWLSVWSRLEWSTVCQCELVTTLSSHAGHYAVRILQSLKAVSCC